MRFLALALMALLPQTSHAADIKILQVPGVNWVVISGDLIADDAMAFEIRTAPLLKSPYRTMIDLESNGGSLEGGIQHRRPYPIAWSL